MSPGMAPTSGRLHELFWLQNQTPPQLQVRDAAPILKVGLESSNAISCCTIFITATSIWRCLPWSLYLKLLSANTPSSFHLSPQHYYGSVKCWAQSPAHRKQTKRWHLWIIVVKRALLEPDRLGLTSNLHDIGRVIYTLFQLQKGRCFNILFAGVLSTAQMVSGTWPTFSNYLLTGWVDGWTM